MKITNKLEQPIHVGAGRTALQLEPGDNEVSDALFVQHEAALLRGEGAGKLSIARPSKPDEHQEILEAKGIVKRTPAKNPRAKRNTKKASPKKTAALKRNQ